MPGELADGLALVAAPARGRPARRARAAPASLDALPAGARVGTARCAGARSCSRVREDLEVVELRGNVDTRLRKLAAGEVDALVLAAAGLERLGRGTGRDGVARGRACSCPRAGQGMLALEARAGDARRPRGRARSTTTATWALPAPPSARVVRGLDAYCHTPVGAHARGAGRALGCAFVGLPDGSAWLRDERAGPGALAERMLAAGAAERCSRAPRPAGELACACAPRAPRRGCPA